MIRRLRVFHGVHIYRFAVLTVMLIAVFSLTTSGTWAAGCANLLDPHNLTPSPLVTSSSDSGGSGGPATIVGLWHVIYTGTSNDNFPPGGPYPPTPFQFLESFKTWHADGTEFENAFLPPAGGNICFGVWKQFGEHSVKLHHIGLMFNAVDGSLSAIFTVDEIDTVSPDGRSYKGSFDFKLWPPNYAYVGKGLPISEVKGSTAATRISVE